MSLFAGGPDKAKKRKVVFVGDYWVGKRALRTKLSHGIVSCNPGAEYRQSTVVEVTISKKGPSLSQWRAVSLRKDSEILQLHLWVLAPEDTNGYCFTEAVLYGAHVVVLCCNMTNSESLESVIHKWFPKIRAYLPHAPVLLASLWDQNTKYGDSQNLTLEEIERAGRRIGATCVLECSLSDKESVDRVRHALAWEASHVETREDRDSRRCIVM